MKSYIIGIAGKAGSGKDTIASMINYIFKEGIAKANYRDYLMKKESIDNGVTKNRIIHFADTLKEVLSLIYNIPINCFYDRKYKDDMWYCFDTNKFYTEKEVDNNRIHFHIISINECSAFDLAYILTHSKESFTVIKLRTLMQYFGTDIARRYLNDDIWIKSTISKAVDIANTFRVCIIPDVRFTNEADAIRKNNEFLYGGVIVVKRNVEQLKHSSESDEVTSNQEIDNNGTKTQLFYKVLECITKLINQNGTK